MSELHREDTLVGALGYRFLGIRILICSARCGRKRHGHHRKGIDPESRVEAMDPGIRYLLVMVMAAELSAELALVQLSVIMP